MSIHRHRADLRADQGAFLRVWLGRIGALLCAAVAAGTLVVPVFAQSGRATVGNIRIGDDTGQTVWEQPAPAGEKLFKAPAGTKQFKVWFEYDGTAARRAVIKVIAPQGVIAGMQEAELSVPGTNSVEFTFEEPLADAEYLVNAYVEVDGRESPADGLTLLVGNAEVIPASNVQNVPVDANSGGVNPAAPVVNPPAGGNDAAAPRAGEPSQLLLLGSGLGVIVLLAIVVWAGMSALKQR
ncbi:MAG: hypothetical protein IPG72_10630 [Ardenticatenales bacterium]|nr:hypothetical protein [Ardenticatenales bacterium]